MEVILEKKRKKNVKSFDTVKTFRAIKDKIDKEIEGMSFEELQKYLQEGSLKFQKELKK